MTTNKTMLSMNRTGLATSPRMAPEMVHAARARSASPAPAGVDLNAVRGMYIANTEPFGTMPAPVSFKEAGVTAVQMLNGNKSVVFMDKLASRLAFERTGTRLYEALLMRVDASPTWEGGPRREDVERIHVDELRHFHLVRQCIEGLGGDPTIISPCSEVAAVASLGLLQVLGDPRVPLRYALEAVLTAELTDNDGWAMLVDLASALGQDDMAAQFRQALMAEEDHLAKVRAWLLSATLADANMDLEEEPGEDQPCYEDTALH